MHAAGNALSCLSFALVLRRTSASRRQADVGTHGDSETQLAMQKDIAELRSAVQTLQQALAAVKPPEAAEAPLGLLSCA